MAPASPIVQATISACLLSATSNILSQFITAYRKDAPYTISFLPVLHFILLTAITTPPNFVWQEFLEATFPSRPPATSSSTGTTNGSTNDSLSPQDKKAPTATPSFQAPGAPPLSIKNTLLKFTLDQTLGASLNTLAFSLLLSSLRGFPPHVAITSAKREFWALMRAGWTLWPLVSLLNFGVVRSVQGRTLVGNVAGVGWGVFLSLRG